MKHPDHGDVFCECFGPCSLCEEWRAQHKKGSVIYPATREVPKSPSLAFKTLLRPKFTVEAGGLEKYDTPLAEILSENSLKDLKGK